MVNLDQFIAKFIVMNTEQDQKLTLDFQIFELTCDIKINVLMKQLYIFLIESLQQPFKNDAGEYKASVKNKWGTDYTTWVLG